MRRTTEETQGAVGGRIGVLRTHVGKTSAGLKMTKLGAWMVKDNGDSLTWRAEPGTTCGR